MYRVPLAQAAVAVVAELEANRAAVATALERHRRRLAAFDATAESGEPSLDFVSEGTFTPANPVSTAWTSARDAAVVETWPYDLALHVSRIYERQTRYTDLGRELGADIYMDLRRRGVDAVLREGYGGVALLMEDFANREGQRIGQYDEVLGVLNDYLE